MTTTQAPSLQGIYDFYLEQRNDFRSAGFTRRSLWTPSKIGGCLKSQYLDAIGQPAKYAPDTLSLRRFHVGDITGESLLRVFHDLGILIYPETPWAPELRLYDEELRFGGRVDAILGGRVSPPPAGASDEERKFLMYVRSAFTKQFGAEIPLIGAEFKSKNSKSWWWAKKQNRPVSNDSNFMQAASYDILVKRLADRGQLPDPKLVDIERWVVLNISKDDNLMAEEGPNGAHRSKVLENLAILNNAFDTHTPPACSCIESGWEYKYCNHFNGPAEMRRAWADGKKAAYDGTCCEVDPTA